MGGDAVLAEGTILARYRLLRAIGSGQMGDVYAAERVADGGRVALKVVRQQVDPHSEMLRRFHREATLCAALRHPNIVPVIDYGVWQRRAFLAMPVLHGTDLESHVERTGALPPEVAVQITIGAARGLQAAHDASIAHRDFKPANVFLDEGEGGAMTVVVCDFGLAKMVDAHFGITSTGAVVGTPLYMAPEQVLDSKRVDGRCDVWALGMTLYHLLAGRAALADKATMADVLVAMHDQSFPALQALAPWIEPELARVVHAMILPIPRRIGSMAEVIDALERAVPDRPRLTRAVVAPLETARRSRISIVAPLPQHALELPGPGSLVPGAPSTVGGPGGTVPLPPIVPGSAGQVDIHTMPIVNPRMASPPAQRSPLAETKFAAGEAPRETPAPRWRDTSPPQVPKTHALPIVVMALVFLVLAGVGFAGVRALGIGRPPAPATPDHSPRMAR